MCFPTSQCHTPTGTKVLPPRPLPLTGALEGPARTLASELPGAPQEMWAGGGSRETGQGEKGVRTPGFYWCLSPPEVPASEEDVGPDLSGLKGLTCSELLGNSNWVSRCTIAISKPKFHTEIPSLSSDFPSKSAITLNLIWVGFVHSFFQNRRQTQPFLPIFTSVISTSAHCLFVGWLQEHLIGPSGVSNWIRSFPCSKTFNSSPFPIYYCRVIRLQPSPPPLPRPTGSHPHSPCHF